MTTEKQLANLELRLRMAVEHVAQCEADLNTIRAKAGLGPAKSLFNHEKPAGAGWLDDPGRAAWLAAQAAKAPSARAPAEESSIHAVIRAMAGRRAEEAAAAAPPAPVKVSADDILRAAAKAKGLLIELPPAGSPARQILEAGAKRRSETLDGKPL